MTDNRTVAWISQSLEEAHGQEIEPNILTPEWTPGVDINLVEETKRPLKPTETQIGIGRITIAGEFLMKHRNVNATEAFI